MILAIDALERQLAPPGFECCERELLGRSWRRDSACADFMFFDNSQKWIFANFQIFMTIGCSGWLTWGRLVQIRIRSFQNWASRDLKNTCL